MPPPLRLSFERATFVFRMILPRFRSLILMRRRHAALLSRRFLSSAHADAFLSSPFRHAALRYFRFFFDAITLSLFAIITMPLLRLRRSPMLRFSASLFTFSPLILILPAVIRRHAAAMHFFTL